MTKTNTQYIELLLNNVPPTNQSYSNDFIQKVTTELYQWIGDPKNLPLRILVKSSEMSASKEHKIIAEIISGTITTGDVIRVQPSGQQAVVNHLWINEQSINQIEGKNFITLSLENSAPVSCGEIISSTHHAAIVADQFEAHIAWLDNTPLYAGRNYLMDLGGQKSNISVTRIKNIFNQSLEKLAANKITHRRIGVCNFSSEHPIVFDEFINNPYMGTFSIIDSNNQKTVGVGIIDFPLRRASNIQNQYFEINKEMRAQIKHQKPVCLWFTGLSGSGKSTIANELEKVLFQLGKHCYILDGDNIRHGLNKDLGFTEADRIENIRRVSEVAKLMVDAGLIVIVTLISPYKKDRSFARSRFKPDEFFEVYVNTPITECEKRDVKGLYKKARMGEIKNFTGIDAPYETPEKPEIQLNTTNNLEKITNQIITFINKVS